MCHSLVAGAFGDPHQSTLALPDPGSSWSWNGIKCQAWTRVLKAHNFELFCHENVTNKEKGSRTPKKANTLQQLAGGKEKRSKRGHKWNMQQIEEGGSSDTGRVSKMWRQIRGNQTDEIKCGKEGESRDGGMRLFLEVIKAEKDWGRFAWQDLWERDGGSRWKKKNISSKWKMHKEATWLVNFCWAMMNKKHLCGHTRHKCQK